MRPDTREDFLLLRDSLGEGNQENLGSPEWVRGQPCTTHSPSRGMTFPLPTGASLPGSPLRQKLTDLLPPDRPHSVQRSECGAEPGAWGGGQATGHHSPSASLRACIPARSPPPKPSDLRLEAQFEGAESLLTFLSPSKTTKVPPSPRHFHLPPPDVRLWVKVWASVAPHH